ncbi:MAG: asparagine synthetase B, partial [Lachnospiraceae bacterium]|nr:asparagine synthetase B [Lachnospiraceae bacterium]
MIKVTSYRGHIRNWENLCRELSIDLGLSREERENEILIKAYEKWGGDMANHMHGMFAFALWDDENEKLFCLRDQFGT